MQLAGGTILGRFQGRNMPAGMSGVARHRKPYQLLGRGFGQDDTVDPSSDTVDMTNTDTTPPPPPDLTIEQEFEALPPEGVPYGPPVAYGPPTDPAAPDSNAGTVVYGPPNVPAPAPSPMDKLLTAAEISAMNTLPALAQAEMLKQLQAGNRVVASPGGQIVVRPRAGGFSLSPQVMTYAGIGLLGIGALYFMSRRRTA
jgi:hypothetical protein